MVCEGSLLFGFRSLRWLGKPYSTEDRLSWWQTLSSVTIITIICTVSIHFSLAGNSFQHERISSVVLFFSLLGNNFLASNLILLNLRKQHPLYPVMKALHSLPFPQPASNHVGWMVVGFVLVMANLCLDSFIFPIFTMIKLIPVFYLNDVLIYLYLAQFVIPLLMIGDQLSNISLSLSSLGKRPHSIVSSEVIYILGVHRELIALCSQLNQIFSLPLLIIIGAKLFGATGSMYYMTCSYFNLLDERNSKIETFTCAMAVMNEFYQIWCIIHTAWKVTEKVNKVNGDLYSLCLNENYYLLIDNEVLTSFIEQRITLSFTAHGLFRLDHSMFRSILATTATYLFIIIQFQIRSNLERNKTLKHGS